MVNYQDKKIVIIGLGLTGLSCIEFFLKRGVIPRVMDTRTVPPFLEKLPKKVKCHLGGINDNWLRSADLVILSPGINIEELRLNETITTNVEIVGDIELFCREATAPIIAITGSNGKSTVTTLVGEMAKASGINVSVGGNIGIPALMLLNGSTELYVLELSSFQLDSSPNLQALAATILNVTEDHMDRYPCGLPQYRSAKLHIYENAKACLVNFDDELTIPIGGMDERCISFGMNMGDYHLNCYQGDIFLMVNGEKILNVKDMNLSSQHNYINALAALALADIIGVPHKISLQVLTTFSGLSHRFQLVLEHNGVRWINDSKATNIFSTIAALKNLKVNGTLYLLLGGDAKSADCSPLGHYLSIGNVRTYCFGKDREKLMALSPKTAQKTETMEQAIEKIALQVKSGDMVLLSPACSSLDQFKNFEHRGDVFTNLAKKFG